MDYNSQEAKDNLKHPLITLSSGRQKDFVKALYFKLALKGAKTTIYYLREEIIRLKIREKRQSVEINRLQQLNKEQKEEIYVLNKAYKRLR